MTKLLYGIGILAMISGGVLFALYGRQWLQGAPQDGNAPGVSLMERAHLLEGVNADKRQDVVSPLIAQATAFALYLDPPKPPASPEAPRPRVNPPQPAPRPVVTTPKFRLLLTSCHHSQPAESLALISEPGRGDHWIKKGDRVGHLVVESIKEGTLLYRDGNQLREMTVTMKPTAELARLTPTPSASTQGVEADVRLVNALRTKQSGVQVPDARPASYEQE